MAYCIALTGRIASGKSTVAKAFAKRNISIISSDTIAKQLTSANQPALQAIANHFGQDLILADGELDRRGLREHIFNNSDKRIWLENLLHPLIRTAIEEKIKHIISPYCLIEIPLLYNKATYPYINRILVVTTPESIALTRIMQRDNCSQVAAQNILNLQNKTINYEELADDILMNDGNLEKLDNAVEQLHICYLRLS